MGVGVGFGFALALLLALLLGRDMDLAQVLLGGFSHDLGGQR